MSIRIEPFFEPVTSTFTYVVHDVDTQKAVIIDSVLDYDPCRGKSDTHSADEVIDYVLKNNLSLEWILETHIHADHITAAGYIKEKLGGQIGVGSGIKEVLSFWVPIFNTFKDTPLDGSQFDHLLSDNEVIKLGNTDITIWHTPGHTPACCSFLIEDCIFVGDTLLMPDLGTARTDFPGGSSETMYDSVKRMLSLPDQTKVFVGHDYPEGRDIGYVTTVQEHNQSNSLVRNGISKKDYVEMRGQRDKGKEVPRLLLPSIQANLRNGMFGNPEDNGIRYIKIPVDRI